MPECPARILRAGQLAARMPEGAHGAEPVVVAIVRHAKLRTGLPHNDGNTGHVHMADRREEVVLDLVVHGAPQLRDRAVHQRGAGAVVARVEHLVLAPVQLLAGGHQLRMVLLHLIVVGCDTEKVRDSHESVVDKQDGQCVADGKEDERCDDVEEEGEQHHDVVVHLHGRGARCCGQAKNAATEARKLVLDDLANVLVREHHHQRERDPMLELVEHSHLHGLVLPDE
mmetsp:Transcript_27936/g.70087  ORF Transcript_27936/g.70087 Transcript_27936/m.70087 type:complete len:227 (-) Transcript_27936:810-1490(-)